MKTWTVATAFDGYITVEADRIAYNPEMKTLMFLKTTLKDGEVNEVLVGSVPADSLVSQEGE